MTRLSIALLIGLGLGAAVSTGAQQPLRPCAASWIAWVYLENGIQYVARQQKKTV